MIWEQGTGKTKRAHAKDLVLAKLLEGETLQVENRSGEVKRSTLGASLSELDSDAQDSESESLSSVQAERNHVSDAKLRSSQPASLLQS